MSSPSDAKMGTSHLPVSPGYSEQKLLSFEASSSQRLRMVEFLIQSAQRLELVPIVKYSALSLFADRFFPSLPRFIGDGNLENWLLQPVRESNLQLFVLISIWISSKIHDSCPLSVRCLKSLADKVINEQHFTTRDFEDAEVLFMQALNYEIGTTNIAFSLLEELWIQIKVVARVGELINFEACMEIMDLLYEKEETSCLYSYPLCVAASILVASYVITVPKQRWEFPILPWVKFVTSCEEEDITKIVREILKHILEPSYEL